jgi:hypothetical protein
MVETRRDVDASAAMSEQSADHSPCTSPKHASGRIAKAVPQALFGEVSWRRSSRLPGW